jgi:hypothetical protein
MRCRGGFWVRAFLLWLDNHMRLDKLGIMYLESTYEDLEPPFSSYLWVYRSRFEGAPVRPLAPTLNPDENSALARLDCPSGARRYLVPSLISLIPAPSPQEGASMRPSLRGHAWQVPRSTFIGENHYAL